MKPELEIHIQHTPNPYAWKYILNSPVLTEGKATYGSIDEAKHNMLASSLFEVEGVRQVHFFQNVITITFHFDADLDNIQEKVSAVLKTRMPVHNPDITLKDEKKIARQNLPPELQKIEEILDRTIRPGLQGDGGDLSVVRMEDNKLYVHYEGACGSCPSATSGTLMAIEGILRDEYQPDLEVIPI